MNGLMEVNIKDNTKLAKEMVKAKCTIQMDLIIRANGKMAKNMVKESFVTSTKTLQQSSMKEILTVS